MNNYYINERWPKSNSKEGVYYVLAIEGMKPRHYYTVDDLQTAVQQLNREGRKIKKAIRIADGLAREFTPETSHQQQDRENWEHCRRIAEEVEAYANGSVHRCPECNEILTLPEDVGEKYRCPDCGTVHEIDDLEQLGLWDYFEDVLDIEYRVEADRKTLRSVSLLVTFGGPNIYIDTASCSVELYWWGDRASFPIDRDVCGEIDSWAEELWQC